MSPDGGIIVSGDDLVGHAGHIEAVAAGVLTARQAGASTRPGPEAYGQLCMAVPLLLGELQDLVVDGLDAAATSLDDTADRLRIAADAYRSADRRSAVGLRGAGGVR